MCSQRKAKASGERGALFVEAALSLPIMLTIVFGVIEFGNITTNKAVIADTVRRSARVLAAQKAVYPDMGTQLITDELALYNIAEEDVEVNLESAYQDINGVDKKYISLTATVSVPCKTCSKLAGLNISLFTLTANSRVLMEEQDDEV